MQMATTSEIPCERKAESDAFSSYLRALVIKSDENLAVLFIYAECEEHTESGRKQMKSMVLDWTQTDILGEFPAFLRNYTTMPRA